MRLLRLLRVCYRLLCVCHASATRLLRVCYASATRLLRVCYASATSATSARAAHTPSPTKHPKTPGEAVYVSGGKREGGPSLLRPETFGSHTSACPTVTLSLSPCSALTTL